MSTEELFSEDVMFENMSTEDLKNYQSKLYDLAYLSATDKNELESVNVELALRGEL